MSTLSTPVAEPEGSVPASPRFQPLPLGALFSAIAAFVCLAVGLLGLDQLPFSLCLFKMTTGLPCPTCGATRAFGRLFHADLPGAFAMNPLVVALTLAFLPWAALDLWLLPQGRALRPRIPQRFRPALVTLALVLLLANWAFLVLAGR